MSIAVPSEALHVFAAWLNHDDSRAINSLDALVQEDGKRFIKHFLLDFGSTLGSASHSANSPRSGFEQFFTWSSSAKEFFSLGLYVPKWSRIDYPDLPSVGRFSAEYFDPVRWTPEYPNPAFLNRLPGDIFWAARQVAAFTDNEIRAVVKTGEYSDPNAEKYVADTIIARRDTIIRTYLSRPLLLDRVKVENNMVRFEDLGVRYGKIPAPVYSYAWSSFDNQTSAKKAIGGATTPTIPKEEASEFIALDVRAGNLKPSVTIYLKQQSGNFKLIGIDRVWD